MSDPADILSMTREQHRRVVAEHLARIPSRWLNTSAGHAVTAIAHALLALSAPEEPKP